MAKTTFIGVCLTAFSCGIMCTVAIDHYWPRGRVECAAQVSTAEVALPVPAAAVVELMPPPALPAPAATPAADPTPAAARAPTRAPKAAATPSRVVVSTRPAAPVHPAPAQGRAAVRNGLAATASIPGSDRTMHTTDF